MQGRYISSTFHSVYISTSNDLNILSQMNPLHSTLFILVPNLTHKRLNCNCSTFHSVYISTQHDAFPQNRLVALHSTLFILVLLSLHLSDHPDQPLHSTLFILVPEVKLQSLPDFELYIPLCLY